MATSFQRKGFAPFCRNGRPLRPGLGIQLSAHPAMTRAIAGNSSAAGNPHSAPKRDNSRGKPRAYSQDNLIFWIHKKGCAGRNALRVSGGISDLGACRMQSPMPEATISFLLSIANSRVQNIADSRCRRCDIKGGDFTTAILKGAGPVWQT